MKKLLFLMSILFLIFIVIFKINFTNNTIFSCSVISKNEYKNLIKNKKVIISDIILYYNGNIVPYDKQDKFYLLSTLSENFIGRISVDNYNVVIVDDGKSKKEIMNGNYSLKLLVYNKEEYKILYLKLSNLPIVNISNHNNKTNFTIFDNITNEKIKIYNYNCNYHIRGASSKEAVKKSYKLNILNKKGNKEKVNLLNMRIDDDWILNSIYLDDSFMREKIGYDLWNQIDDDIKYNVNYVELFIDNEYMGLYYLMEPLDMKKISSNKTRDLLMTVKNWRSDIIQRDIFDDNFKNNYKINEFEFESGDYDNFLNILRGFVKIINNKEYIIKIDYNLDNITNYDLFVNLILAIDNTYKNTKVFFENDINKYTTYFYPWDLDWSQSNTRLLKYFDINKYLNVSLINNNIKNNEKYNDLLKKKYYFARKNYYNITYINNLIDKYVYLLSSGGALSRNSDRWETSDFNLEVDVLRNFYEQRIEVLDNYFGGNNGV